MLKTNSDVCYEIYKKAKPFIKNFNNAIDVGCRDGDFTKHIIKDFSMCYSYDYRPRGPMYTLLNNNGLKIKYFNVGLSDKAEKVTAWGGVITDHRNDSNISKRKTVDLSTLDSYNITDVGLIKIDVEGHELKVIKGGLETINICQPVIIIEQNNQVEKFNKGLQYDALNFLKTLDYDVVDKYQNDFILKKK